MGGESLIYIRKDISGKLADNQEMHPNIECFFRRN